MYTSRSSKERKAGQIDRNRIARAIFAAAESVGISDRRLAEQLTAGVIQRLERMQRVNLPLPGMEELVSKAGNGGGRALASDEIQAVVEDVLAKTGYAEIAKAYRPTPLKFWRKGT